MKGVIHSRLEKCIIKRNIAIKNAKEYLFENMLDISQEFNIRFPKAILQMENEDLIEWIIENSQKFLSQRYKGLEHVEFVYLVEDLIVSDNNVRIAETIESLCV